MDNLFARLAGAALALALTVGALADTVPFWLTASDSAPQDNFGVAVSISGDLAILGARFDDHSGLTNPGSAYIFIRTGSTWTEEMKLTATPPAANQQFGASVAISGDVAIVGAHGDDGSTSVLGVAYIFRRTAPGIWVQEAKVKAADGVVGDDFGYDVAIDGEVAVVGSRYDDLATLTDAGSAYVYRHDGLGGWPQEAEVYLVDPRIWDRFGTSVSVFGDWIAVGVPLRGVVGSIPDCGSAVLFEWTGAAWMQRQEIWASDRGANDWLGVSMSIYEDVLITGARGDLSQRGSAYIFRWNESLSQWIQEKKLLASDGVSGDNFGRSVAIRGPLAVVGADLDDHGGQSDAGSAYVYERVDGIWSFVEKLGMTETLGNEFGNDIALSSERVIVGVPYDTHAGGFEAGCGFIYDFGDDPCAGDVDFDGDVGFTDLLAVLAAWGPCPDCPADQDGDGDVGFTDLLVVLAAWGPCP
ncbi:MAG: hypothetical protein HKO59_17470 [Phycisphaerales bacterium]|nr:hypothetical protein [Phycisphaerales bacterium]